MQVRFAFIEAQKAEHPVRVLCRVLAVSSSGFYEWHRRPEAAHDRQDRKLGVEIAAIHRENRGVFGSPRIHDQLQKRGEQVSKKRVARIMREHGITAKPAKRFRRTTDSSHGLPVAKNILKRKFEIDEPNKAWVADITYVRTWEGWLYVAMVLDLFSRRIVGWAVADHMRTELALDALRMAVRQRRPDAGLVHHSDRGCQYASHAYRDELASHGVTCSMSRKGDCWDNAVAESFFATLKGELIDRDIWPTKSRAMAAINEYIACFYNPKRTHSELGYVSPIEYEVAARRLAEAA
jgi:putative transposase